MRGEAKARGLPDTKDICWRIFIERVRPPGPARLRSAFGCVAVVCIAEQGANIWASPCCAPRLLCQVVKNLHVCFTCSPVGEAFRIRSQRFLATINNTVVDWFHPWCGRPHRSCPRPGMQPCSTGPM